MITRFAGLVLLCLICLVGSGLVGDLDVGFLVVLWMLWLEWAAVCSLDSVWCCRFVACVWRLLCCWLDCCFWFDVTGGLMFDVFGLVDWLVGWLVFNSVVYNYN